jgi:hypothetical protein
MFPCWGCSRSNCAGCGRVDLSWQKNNNGQCSNCTRVFPWFSIQHDVWLKFWEVCAWWVPRELKDEMRPYTYFLATTNPVQGSSLHLLPHLWCKCLAMTIQWINILSQLGRSVWLCSKQNIFFESVCFITRVEYLKNVAKMWMLCVDWLSCYFVCEYTWYLCHLRAESVTHLL